MATSESLPRAQLEFTAAQSSSAATTAPTSPLRPPKPPKPLSLAELRVHPATGVLADDAPTPTSLGRATVAKNRSGGPFQLSYKIFGTGSKRIVWLSGHGSGVEGYYPYAQKLGLDDGGNHYTSLLIDNRGINDSDGPWSLCSMDDLAYDTLDLLDHLGWPVEGQTVNVVGHSMGGMMAIKMAILRPSLIGSLTLISTTCSWVKDASVLTATKATLSQLIPKSEDQRMNETKAMLFGQAWLEAPAEKGVLPTNGDVFAARSLSYKVQAKGAIIQAPASMRHNTTPEQVGTMRKLVGGHKIQILHGTADRLLPVEASQRTLEWLGGEKACVERVLYDGVGHMPHEEHFRQVLSRIKSMVDGCAHKGRAEEDR